MKLYSIKVEKNQTEKITKILVDNGASIFRIHHDPMPSWRTTDPRSEIIFYVMDESIMTALTLIFSPNTFINKI